MPGWLVIAALVATALVLQRVGSERRRSETRERLRVAEERLNALAEESRKLASTTATLQRLLVEKGVADADDFADARRDAAIEEASRDVH